MNPDTDPDRNEYKAFDLSRLPANVDERLARERDLEIEARFRLEFERIASDEVTPTHRADLASESRSAEPQADPKPRTR